MTTAEELIKLYDEITLCDSRTDNIRNFALPENCCFIDDDRILCRPRNTGDSRYPYFRDGLTLWAHSSGYMSLNESTFYHILSSCEGKEPYIAFFGGLMNESEHYIPVSVTGVAAQPQEINVKRYTVFTPTEVWYVAKKDEVLFGLRAFVSKNKEACFSLTAVNLSKEIRTVYLSAYFNCLFMHQAGECVETKWFKQCKALPDGFVFESVEDLDRTVHLVNYGTLSRVTDAADINYFESTTSRSDYTGGLNNSLVAAKPLFDGHFALKKPICKFTDTAVAGDIGNFTLAPNKSAAVHYVLKAGCGRAPLNLPVTDKNYCDILSNAAAKKDTEKQNSPKMLKMHFGKFLKDEIDGGVFTKFTKSVLRQTEFAALAKNSGVSLLGMRDVMQQLEAALMWNPSAAREKIIEALGFVDPSGRVPRQYSLPAEGALPQIDTREFIDQGEWILTTVYRYLSFTEDYSLLSQICGYYKITGRNRVERTCEKDTVKDHLVRIANYLLSKTDSETGCLRALYGDWNDALDGLGVSADKTQEFGSGVSVMATEQLYANLAEISEILTILGCDAEKYRNAREKIRNALISYAVETNEKGERKILHGWGDKRAYKVGSFNDCDGKSRDGLTANAYWVLSGMYNLDTSVKESILSAYDRLSGKYGLKTFEPYFAPDAKGVGRIVNLPKGSAENAATYIHAALFGVMSLFAVNESERGWKEFLKVLPITHSSLSATPFVMSNSYCFNEELGMDGESMSDWFTGSANVFVKVLVRGVFGICPDLGKIVIAPAEYMPFDFAKISLFVKNKPLKLTYTRKGNTSRRFEVNGKTANPFTDEVTLLKYIVFDAAKWSKGKGAEIAVTDE